LGFILKGITVYGFPDSGRVVTERWLEVAPNGRFILASVSFGGAGDPSGVSVRFSSVPPDRRGRYEFLLGGLLRLSYESGTVEDPASSCSTARRPPTRGRKVCSSAASSTSRRPEPPTQCGRSPSGPRCPARYGRSGTSGPSQR
jgi:hypothetical protein